MRQEKELLLNEIKDKIDASTAMILTRYDKLAPNTSWQLRDLLAKSGGGFEVVRKRVFLKAAEKAGIQIDASLLKGHLGVVFITQLDAMPSAKLIYKFSEENGKIFEVLVGQIEGKMIPAADLEMLSKLPGIDEMRASLLGLFVSPMSQMLAVLEAVMAEPLSVIEQKS
ncbi:MAG: 50S ribosomal protein L10 [Chlamydiia bacterium]|nr:50S ribosomal protein L10 [Chlamydiia bacterium]